MSTQVLSPFPYFTDRTGNTLNNGYVYIGQENQDPELFPQAVYWDAALTIPATQPLRTVNGYVVNGSTPAAFFTSAGFSIRVKTSASVQAFYRASVPDVIGALYALLNTSFGRVVANVAALMADTTLTYTAAQPGTVLAGDYVRTLQEGYAYKVASSFASDWGLVTAGGVKLYVQLNDAGEYVLNAFGTNGTQAGDSAARNRAVAAASVNWTPIRLLAQRYYFDATVVVAQKVRLWGAGCPAINSGQTALVGGTIIQGPFAATADYVDYRDFGCELTNTTDTDGIKALSSSYNSGVSLHAENLIALGNNRTTSTAHAVLFEGFQKCSGGNVAGYKGNFGVVVKCRNFEFTSLIGINNRETGVFFKSDDTYGACGDGSVDTIVTDGGTDRNDYGVRFQSDSAEMHKITVGSISARNHNRAICPQTLDVVPGADVLIDGVRVGTIYSEGSGFADWSLLSLKSGTGIRNTGYDTLISVNPKATGTASAKSIEMSCEAGAWIDGPFGERTSITYASGKVQTDMDGAGFIGSGVTRLNFGPIDVVQDGSALVGAVSFANTSEENVTHGGRCKFIGSGAPRPGYSSQALSGSSNTLLVRMNDAGQGRSFIRTTNGGAVAVTNFGPLLTGDVFPFGYVVTVFNNSSADLTMTNGGNIINTNYANVILGENEMAAWVYSNGGVWVQQWGGAQA